MLPWWRDHLRIGLTRHYLSVVRLSKGVHPHIAGKTLIPFLSQPSQHPWIVAAKTLETFVSHWRGQRADVTLILSNEFARYVMVPWSNQLDDSDEELAFTRYCFSKAYGDFAQHWTPKISYEPSGKNRLACAINGQLIEMIKNSFSNSKLKLISIQPLMMSAINLWRNQIKNHSAWFLLLEGNHAYLAQIEKGDWRSLRHTKWHPSSPKELLRFIQRERLNAGLSEQIKLPLLVFAPGFVNPVVAKLAGWSIFHLTPDERKGFSPSSDIRHAITMCYN